jgi:hypothetical protein
MTTADKPGADSAPASPPKGRSPAKTSGAPYPVQHTENDGPERRAPRVPAAEEDAPVPNLPTTIDNPLGGADA